MISAPSGEDMNKGIGMHQVQEQLYDAWTFRTFRTHRMHRMQRVSLQDTQNKCNGCKLCRRDPLPLEQTAFLLLYVWLA